MLHKGLTVLCGTHYTRTWVLVVGLWVQVGASPMGRSAGYGDYEYSSPITVYGAQTTDQGGSQGSAQGLILRSPFGAEACEWAVQLIAFEASGTLSISPDGMRPSSVAATNDGGVRGYIFNAPAAEVICPEVCFTPLTNGILSLSFNISSSKNVTVTFLFRRHRGHVEVGEYPETYYAANPEDELLVNEARARAIAGRRQTPGQVAKSESSTPGRR